MKSSPKAEFLKRNKTLGDFRRRQQEQLQAAVRSAQGQQDAPLADLLQAELHANQDALEHLQQEYCLVAGVAAAESPQYEN
jgi:hypothetical protein